MHPAGRASVAPRPASHAGQRPGALALLLTILLIVALGSLRLGQTTQQAVQNLLGHPTSATACNSTTAATYSTSSPAYCVEGTGRVLAVSSGGVNTGMWLKIAIPRTSAGEVDVDWTKHGGVRSVP